MRKWMLLIFFLLSYSLWAETTAPVFNTPSNTPKEEFDISAANKNFDQIYLKLSTQNLNVRDLQQAIKTLQKLNTLAQDCIETTQKKLNNINNLLTVPITSPTDKQSPPLVTENNHTADQLYLQKEAKRLTNTQAQCRLFTIRASDALTAYQSTVAELKKEETFSQTLPIWKGIPKLIKNFQTHALIKKKLDLNWSQVNWQLYIIHLFSALLLSLYLYWNFSRIPKFKKIFRLKGEHLEWVFSLFFTLWMLLNWIWYQLHPALAPELKTLFKICSIYSGLIFANHFIFSIKRIRALFYWYGLDFKYFDNLITIIIYIIFLGSLGHWIKPIIEPSHSAVIGTQTLLLLVILFFNLIYVYRFIRQHLHFNWVMRHRNSLRTLAILFSITCLTCDMIGYHILAMRLVYSGLTITFIAFCTSLLILGIQKIYTLTITSPQNKNIRYLFGFREQGNFTEFLILKLTLQIIVIAGGCYLIGQSMGFVSFYVDLLYAPLLNGIVFSNFTIYPARIIFGMIIFCLLFLISRILSAAISRHYQFEQEEDTQVAVASILNYIGFTIALIAALLTAGFNFTGLAIVAGALSVGIGLGLQSIVNNFVSGLILLIEKPIKPGDRINVDGVEGTVKKIRVRSTQIITPQREDIIVPNSDLVTRRVTNYMYTDKYLSIFCQVHVAYNSDVKLVNELLLQAAYSHDDVIKTGRQKPNVLFKGFGDHALIFQLWCLIRDANKKSIISSDLNYAIFKLFNEHQVVMPMPQQMVFLQDLKTSQSN